MGLLFTQKKLQDIPSVPEMLLVTLPLPVAESYTSQQKLTCNITIACRQNLKD